MNDWIPVWERSPEFDDNVDMLALTVEFRPGAYGEGDRQVYPGSYDLDEEAFYTRYGGLPVKVSKIGRVVAWMPMPGVYEGQ